MKTKRNTRHFHIAPAAILLAGALLLAGPNLALAQKGGGKPQARYLVTELVGAYVESFKHWDDFEVNEPDSGGVVLVSGARADTVFGNRGAVWVVGANGVVLNVYDPAKPDWFSDRAYGVNDAGVVVGRPYFANVPGVGVLILPWSGFQFPDPVAVNNLNQVVGNSGSRGYLWTIESDGSIGTDELGTFRPNAINDWGVMAGSVGSIVTGQAAIAWFESLETTR